MDQQTLLIIIAVFTGVAALALLIQAGMMYGTYRASKALRDSVMPLVPKVEALVETSHATLNETKAMIADVKVKTSQILDSGKKQLTIVEAMLQDASVMTRKQIAHADVVLDDVLRRAELTVDLVHEGILRPIRSLNGLAAGIRAGIEFMLRKVRANPDQVTVDEEMFI